MNDPGQSTDQRTVVRYFVSYAHDDQELADELLAALQGLLAISGRYQFIRWSDRNIDLGSEWRSRIAEAIQSADVGLLLVSPSFLGSEFIRKHELPEFLNSKKLCAPVALKRIDFARHDLKGLEERQIFILPSEKSGRPRPYSQCKTHAEKEDFAFGLFLAIEEQLDISLPTPAKSKPIESRAPPAEPRKPTAKTLTPSPIQPAKQVPSLPAEIPEAKPTELNAPQLETLAVIAYHEPVTRSDVEAVLGVAVDGEMQILLDRGFIKITGRAEAPRRLLLYSTTEYFLEHFGLKTKDEFPHVSDLKRAIMPAAAPSPSQTTSDPTTAAPKPVLPVFHTDFSFLTFRGRYRELIGIMCAAGAILTGVYWLEYGRFRTQPEKPKVNNEQAVSPHGLLEDVRSLSASESLQAIDAGNQTPALKNQFSNVNLSEAANHPRETLLQLIIKADSTEVKAWRAIIPAADVPEVPAPTNAPPSGIHPVLTLDLSDVPEVPVSKEKTTHATPRATPFEEPELPDFNAPRKKHP